MLTRNKKKLRRMARQLFTGLAGRAGRTLVLATVLTASVLATAGMAVAAPVPYDPSGNSTAGADYNSTLGGATLDKVPAFGDTNVEGKSLLDVVASVNDATVNLEGTRTGLKGLNVTSSTPSTIIVGSNSSSSSSSASVLNLVGDAADTRFSLDGTGTANINVASGSTLLLGKQGGEGKSYGTLKGTVDLTSADDKLVAANGTFTVKSVTGDGSVKVSRSLLAAMDSIEATNLDVDGGWAFATEGITLDTLTMADSLLGSGGDITLKNGMAGAIGQNRIESSGSIITTDANISQADGAMLTLEAGDNINVGTGSISAHTVQAGVDGTITATGGISAETLTAGMDINAGSGAIDASVVQAGEGKITATGGMTADALKAYTDIDAGTGAINSTLVQAFTGKITATGGITANNLLAGTDIDAGAIESATVVAGGHINAGTISSRALVASALSTTGDVTIESSFDAPGSLFLMGSSASTVGGSLSLTNTVAQVGSLDVPGELNVTGDMLLDSTSHMLMGALSVGGNMALTGNSTGILNSLTLDGDLLLGESTLLVHSLTVSGGEVTVGSATGKGVLVAEEANLNGASVFLDPAWKGNDNITDASQMAVGGDTVTGLYTVGRHSWVSMGSTDLNWLPNAFAENGPVWGQSNVSAALGIYAPQSLAATNGGIMVNGALTDLLGAKATANHAEFAAGSLLAVNVAGLNGQAALTADGGSAGVAKVADGAKLMLVDAKSNGVYTILDGFGDASSAITGQGWSGSNLISSSYMLLAALNDDLDGTGSVSVTMKRKAAHDVFSNMSSGMAGMVDSLYAQNLNSTQSPNAGVAFVSRATDTYIASEDQAAKSLESAAQMAMLGGAPQVAADAVATAAGVIGERTGVSLPAYSRSAGIASGDNGYSFGLWASPLYRHNSVTGLKSGAFKYDVTSNLGGGIIGFDVTNPLMDGDLRLGAALNVGGGSAKSKGDLEKTKNSFDFWGASLYGGYRWNSFGLSADLGYSSTSSDIKQNMLASLQMGSQLKSKVDAHAYTFGMKAEYVFSTSAVDITPSVGARYTAYRQGSHNVTNQHGAVFNMGKAEMNTWTFPIGVKFSRDLDMAGWKLTPELNLAVVPAAGDTKLKSKASIPGLAVAPASLSGHVFDTLTGEVGLGVKLAKDNLSFGLNYDFQGGSHQKAHNIMGTFRLAF